MAGLNRPVGGGLKLARFLGTLLVQGHGERVARRTPPRPLLVCHLHLLSRPRKKLLYVRGFTLVAVGGGFRGMDRCRFVPRAPAGVCASLKPCFLRNGEGINNEGIHMASSFIAEKISFQSFSVVCIPLGRLRVV